MNEQLSEQQMNKILPLLSVIAKHIGNGMIPDNKLLETLSQSVDSADAMTLQELELWADMLVQVRTEVGSEGSIIQLLQDRGIPWAPAILAVNVASGPPAILKEAPISAWDSLQSESKPTIDYRGILEPTESYHEWLPDHAWHNDLDWGHLPSFIRDNRVLMDMLLQGKEVNSQNVSYKITNYRLMRKLHDDRPALSLEAPREKYHEWLPDHKWHDDLDWWHTPSFILKPRVLNVLIQGKSIDGRNVSYKINNNRLMRKLHDEVPIFLQIEKPNETYHEWLPDHAWHNDLDWGHLPLWIKGNPTLINELRRGRQISGRRILYKMVKNKLMRKLKDGVPIYVPKKR